jgi:uncharacterized protein
MVLERALHIKISSLLKQFPAVAILGPRQVGKTTLAKQIADSSKKKTIYIDLEKEKDRLLLSDIDSFLEDYKHYCVIIDEVQTMPEVFTALRPAIDEHRKPGRFILLGSASPKLVKGVSESLAGRIYYTELTAFALTEVSTKITMNKHWLRGGFPTSTLAKSDTQSEKWVESFIETYIQRDMSFIFTTEINSRILRYLWAMIGNNQGNIWNAETYARAIGISAPTVVRYLDFLEAAYLVRRLHPFSININKRLVKAPKVYIRDTGVLHSLCNINSMAMLKSNVLIGASWEGYVIEEICKALPKDVFPFYYRTQAGTECDLVLVRGITVLACIEIKHSNSPVLTKGFFESLKDLQPKKSFVITPNSATYKLKSNTIVVKLETYLQELLLK